MEQRHFVSSVKRKDRQVLGKPQTVMYSLLTLHSCLEVCIGPGTFFYMEIRSPQFCAGCVWEHLSLFRI